MSEFIGNSNASKIQDDNKNISPVTSNVVVKKQSEISKVGKKLFAEDAKSVGSHVLDNVVIPSIQKIISDCVKNAIDWLIYGVKGTSSNSSGIRNVSYASYYDKNRSQSSNPQPVNRPSVYAINDVIFNERGDAEEVLLRLKELVDRYGMASVGEFYEHINQKSDYTSQKYGWRDLSSAAVIRRGNGYSIQFPKIVPLE